MYKIMSIATVAGALLVSPMLVPAGAQGLNIEVGPGGVRAVPNTPYNDYQDTRPRRGCSERQARAAAMDEGLRNPEVVRTTARVITVEGDTRRGPERIRFANEPGCPTLG